MHPNLCHVPAVPETGWTKDLANLPTITFRTLYEHFTERVERDVDSGVVVADSGMDGDVEGDDTSEEEAGQKFRAFRGLDKGYRFFRDGHVQGIEFHPLPDDRNVCYVRATVLPSMMKDRKYTTIVCFSNREADKHHVSSVRMARCMCPAGLAGSCNHIAGLLYALDDFVRLGLREEAAKACTEKLMAWNRPRARKVAASRARDVHLVKAEYSRRDKRGKKVKIPFYDPRPTNLRLPNPDEIATLVSDLQEIHLTTVAEDPSGLAGLYGSSCWLGMLEPSPPPSSETTTASSASGSDTTTTESSDAPVASALRTGNADQHAAEPMDTQAFYQQFVVVGAEEASAIELATRTQSNTPEWYRQRRLRVTATLAKSVVSRRSTDFTPVVRTKLAASRPPTAPMRYGRKHEPDAVQAYCRAQQDNGQPVAADSSGLVIMPSKPWLSASPDAIITRAADQGKHLLEVKCPYQLRDGRSAGDYLKSKSCCLAQDGSSVVLKRSHAYYFQVQLQMLVCDMQRCDFVVWSPAFVFTEVIQRDPQFLARILPKLEAFYFDHLLPALAAELA